VDAANGVLKMTIPVHGVVLYKLTAAKGVVPITLK